MTGRTSINITSRTVYTNEDLSDDQFNIFADGFFINLKNPIRCWCWAA